MNFIFLMDPLETVNPKKDTSFIFMIGAQKKGHRTFFLPEGGLSFREGEVLFDVTEVTPRPEKDFPFDIINSSTITQDDVDVVFVRTDPPFDPEYLMHTWLLDLLPKSIPVINSTDGLRRVNEKVWAAQFTDLMPKTLITRNPNHFKNFLAEHKKIVSKPANGFGGQGVFIVEENDTNANVIFETLTNNSTEEIIIQKYVPAATEGDKRILLLDGEILGAILRLHGKDDHRNNFFAGGSALACDITERDREVVARLKPYLKKYGLHFVGIDMLGDFLVEVNVTSPTCVQEMNHIYGCKLEDEVINFAEKLINESKNL